MAGLSPAVFHGGTSDDKGSVRRSVAQHVDQEDNAGAEQRTRRAREKEKPESKSGELHGNLATC